jgi:hypothetical protein
VVWDFGLFEWGGVRWGSIELKGDSCLVLRMTRGGAGMMREGRRNYERGRNDKLWLKWWGDFFIDFFVN